MAPATLPQPATAPAPSSPTSYSSRPNPDSAHHQREGAAATARVERRRGRLMPPRPPYTRARPDLGPHGGQPLPARLRRPMQGSMRLNHHRRSSRTSEETTSRKPPPRRPPPPSAPYRSLRRRGQPRPARCSGWGLDLRRTAAHRAPHPSSLSLDAAPLPFFALTGCGSILPRLLLRGAHEATPVGRRSIRR